jgi:hypothetical protein
MPTQRIDISIKLQKPLKFETTEANFIKDINGIDKKIYFSDDDDFYVFNYY